MANSQLHRRNRRAEASFFDPKEYYTLNNFRYAGFNLMADSDKVPGILQTAGTSDSENWQFFFQDGQYYIRNYHWGAGMQLGLTPSSKAKPQMYARSGDLGQQWSLRKTGNSFVMVNQLAGPSSNFSTPGNGDPPGMYSGVGGETWNITINER